MWQVWALAKQWKQRPSEFLGLDDPWVAYCLDEAVFTWGAYVESEMRKAEDAQKEVNHKMQARQNTLHALLSERDIATVVPNTSEPAQPVSPPKGRFADPAAVFGNKT